ncbi:MAG: uroporphyrinogen decarboxylase family protein [Candidatus Methanomethylicia archaeon]
MMTPRERIKSVINFKKPDVLPWIENFYDETIIKWFREGFPVDKVTVIEWMVRVGRTIANWPVVLGFDPYKYFGCQNLFGCYVPIDTGPIPRFKSKIIEENERYVKLITETGAIAKRFKSTEYIWYSMPMFLEFPVKDRKTWEEYKKRLNPEDPRRYPKDWHKDDYIEVFENYQAGNTILVITGFYGFGAQLMGIENFNTLYYKDRELMYDMIEHWEYFYIETVREAVETLKNRIDMIFWWEDLAERHGPCISPKIYKEVFLPHYKNVTNFFRKNGIDKILMDSDGNLNPLLDLISEAGITGLWPLEVNSYMDAREIKKKYGNKFFLIGNLDKRELVKGGEAMRKEIDSKVPLLKELGGYIPGIDHLVPVEFTFKKFKEYCDYLKKYLIY